MSAIRIMPYQDRPLRGHRAPSLGQADTTKGMVLRAVRRLENKAAEAIAGASRRPALRNDFSLAMVREEGGRGEG